MTLTTKTSRYNKKNFVDSEDSHKTNIHLTILVILISCLGAFTGIMISGLYGPIIFITPLSSGEKVTPTADIDLGSVNGYVISSDGLPVGGASVAVYKQMGLANSADKNLGYSTSAITGSDGSYIFDDLPSGVYKFIVTYPDNTIHTLNNYAVWPSSSSSYDIKVNSYVA
jgi:carboxypeptidase family protein